MTLNKRETLIAWLLGAALGAVVLYYGVDWWVVQRASFDDQKIKFTQQIAKDANTVKVGKADVAEFEKLGIQTVDPTRLDLAATDRLIQTKFNGGGLTFTQWAGSGTPRPAAASKEFPVASKDFLEAKYTATATTTTARLARFLQYIENTKMPARIDGMTITTPKPGIDNLRVEFTITALIYGPKPVATAPAGRGGAGGPEATRPATGTRPATRTSTRSATATGTKPATKPASTQDLSKIEQEMEARRVAEAARLATMPVTSRPAPATIPAPATAPATRPLSTKSPEEIEQALMLRRQEQQKLAEAAGASQPAAATAPTATAPTATAPTATAPAATAPAAATTPGEPQ